MVYYKKYLDYFVNKNTGKSRWGYVIFFVTNRCNARCRHCFYWKNLNTDKDELTLEEIKKITEKIGKTHVLLLSGGEPFLRKDMFEIISIFIKNTGVKVVSIPTNALLTKEIEKTTKKLTDSFPNVLFSINPSIDNLWEKNDALRGIKGSFKNSIDTIKSLEKLKKTRKNLEIVINTTISNLNYKNIDKIIEFFKNYNIAYHNFELLRGKPKEKSLNLPNSKIIKSLHKKIIETRNYYIERNSKNMNFFDKFLEKLSVLGIMKYTHIIKENILNKKPLPFTCSAGKNIIVLEPDGEIRLCELLPSIGNIRNFDYDIERILKNKKAKDMFNFIKKCRCTHICFINMSIANDKKSLLKIPYYFSKWKN